MATRDQNAAAIDLQIMWTRLISVVEEQAQALLRTAFGSVVREAGDLSAGVYDIEGRMIAQAVTGTPGHVNTMAMAVGHFLQRFPAQSLEPGDVLVTNDPWLGTGHLFDFVMVTPAFHNGNLVAFFASTSHVTDVGGRGFSADAQSIFEEGILIPHMHIRRNGLINEELFKIISANSRNPDEVIGDIRSLISSNDVGVERLQAMLNEFAISSLDKLAEYILTSSAAATRKAIARVPNGNYKSSMTLDGYESPIVIHTELTVDNDKIILDYTGTSTASRFGINSPKCYTDAYTVFGLKCIIAPDVPNNHASLSCFDVKAEEGSCVAPLHPAPVTARHVIGQMLPDAVFGCLAQALPEATPAESAGSIWVLAMSHTSERGTETHEQNQSKSPTSQSFNVMNVGIGGMGASPTARGLNTTAFPSGVGSIPIEITESEAPLLFKRKEFIPDSGGAGMQPGGLAQQIEIMHAEGKPFQVSAATWDRLHNPPRGRSGGQDGCCGSARLSSGETLIGKTTHTIPAGDALVVSLPGGGGYGNPRDREKSQVIKDLDRGYITHATAQDIYGITDSESSSTRNKGTGTRLHDDIE